MHLTSTPVDKNKIELSVIVPIYNEEDSIEFLYVDIKKTLATIVRKSEIIFVDDGSSDKSGKILSSLGEKDKDVKLFKFILNKGQHKAIEKGFREAKGDIIVTIDGDLQNDPSDIPKLIAKLNEGFDVVCGWRSARKDPFLKIIKSRFGNFFQSKITKLRLRDMSCTMRAYKKKSVKNLVLKHKYEIGLLPYILSKRTNKITEIKIKHHERIFGKSKYNLLPTIMGTVFCYFKLVRSKKHILGHGK